MLNSLTTKFLEPKIAELKGDLSLKDDSHLYLYRGKPLISVTSLLRDLTPQFESNKKSKEIADRTGRAQKDILAEWRREGCRTAKIGTGVHRCAATIARLFGQGVCPDFIPAVVKSSHSCRRWLKDVSLVDAIVKFYKDWDLSNPLAERKICSEDFGLAGTVDLIADSGRAQAPVLVDWKVIKEVDVLGYGKSLRPPLDHLPNANYYVYTMQLNLYRLILKAMYHFEINTLIMVRLMPGQYEYYEVPVLEDDARNVVSHYLTSRKHES